MFSLKHTNLSMMENIRENGKQGGEEYQRKHTNIFTFWGGGEYQRK